MKPYTTIQLLYIGVSRAANLSVTPSARNVSEGTEVHFSCFTPYNNLSLEWSGGPTQFKSVNDELPEGGRRNSIRFPATSEFNGALITCTAGGFVNGKGVYTNESALLLVQGKQR